MSKYEVTQEQWKRVMGDLPGELTAALIEGPDFPVGNMNFAEAESFCERLTELRSRQGAVPDCFIWLAPNSADRLRSTDQGNVTNMP